MRLGISIVKTADRIGAIPFQMKGGEVLVLLVTSMSRARWIFPKGVPDTDESPRATCLREAFEEAGVRGEALTDFPIHEIVETSGGAPDADVLVTFYPVLVREILEDWPEQPKRLRHWVRLEDAASLTKDQDTREIIRAFRNSIDAITEAITVRI